jgi:myo-inositol-1(or 4)-monophosphatase
MNSPRQVALSAVKEAGRKLLDLTKNKLIYQLKNSHDILAEGDLVSEKIILETIKKAFPTHGFLSEESGKDSKSDYLWVIDPIDGTINFSRHIDEYCISVALVHKAVLELGVIYQPSYDQLYFAERGKGAFLNDKRIQVSTEKDLVNCLLATDNSSKLDTRLKNFDLLKNICLEVRQIRIFGSSALHLAKVAEGKLDVYFKTSSNYWDYAAGLLLVQEAGGLATDFKGNEIAEDSENIVVSNGLIHNRVLELLNK